jgi:hypothetical protein
MGLVLSQYEDDIYYIIASENIEAGSYISIKKAEIDVDTETDKGKVKDYITAPQAFRILRGKIVEKEGGIEKVVQDIKDKR